MITVTLGTISYPFDRAVHWLNLLLEQEIINEPVFLQHGVTDVKAICHHRWVTAIPFLTLSELADTINSSRLIISHAGQGSTRKLAVQDKSFVIMPRSAEHGEHVDNHQVLFAEGVKQLGVKVCTTLEDLESAINQPPEPLQKDLFSGPKLGDFLAQKYSPDAVCKLNNYYAGQQP